MIAANSGRPEECAIGIAVSGRHPGLFKQYNLSPGGHFVIPTAPAYRRELGHGRNVFQRGNMIYAGFMGHTALFTRMNGQRQEPVVGFFPKPGIQRDINAWRGRSVQGQWHEDNWMFNDAAALAWEIPVSLAMADAMRDMLRELLNTPATIFNYQTGQDPGEGAVHSRNCVAAILVILEEFSVRILMDPQANTLDGRAKTEITRVVRQMKAELSGGGFKQGHMQRLVLAGFTHLPT